MPKPKHITKNCKKHGPTQYTLEGRGYYRCIKCRSAAVAKRRHKLKQQLVDYFGGQCIVCGYSKFVGCLDFHHLDPDKKDFGLSYKGLTRSFSNLLDEAEKCILVCNRCHGEIHGEVICTSSFAKKQVEILNKHKLEA